MFVAGDKRETGGREREPTQREKKPDKILTKAQNEGGKEIPAIAYFYESDYKNVKESIDYQVQSSKCLPFYQDETINMKLVFVF